MTEEIQNTEVVQAVVDTTSVDVTLAGNTVDAAEELRYPTAEELAANPALDPNKPILDAGISEEEAAKLGLLAGSGFSADYAAQRAAAIDAVTSVNPMQLMQPLQSALGVNLDILISSLDAYAEGINSVYNRHIVLDEEDYIKAMHKHDFGFHSGKIIEAVKTIQAHFAHVANFHFPWIELEVPEPTEVPADLT